MDRQSVGWVQQTDIVEFFAGSLRLAPGLGGVVACGCGAPNRAIFHEEEFGWQIIVLDQPLQRVLGAPRQLRQDWVQVNGVGEQHGDLADPVGFGVLTALAQVQTGGDGAQVLVREHGEMLGQCGHIQDLCKTPVYKIDDAANVEYNTSGKKSNCKRWA